MPWQSIKDRRRLLVIQFTLNANFSSSFSDGTAIRPIRITLGRREKPTETMMRI